jgi:uncharacterized protein YdcH (DUF465 family)
LSKNWTLKNLKVLKHKLKLMVNAADQDLHRVDFSIRSNHNWKNLAACKILVLKMHQMKFTIMLELLHCVKKRKSNLFLTLTTSRLLRLHNLITLYRFRKFTLRVIQSLLNAIKKRENRILENKTMVQMKKHQLQLKRMIIWRLKQNKVKDKNAIIALKILIQS